MGERIQIGLLGPMTVSVDGRPVAITGQRRRAVLAALALSPDRAVRQETLAEHVWGDDLPAGVRGGLHTIVTRLRRVLCVDVIDATHGGHRLRIDPQQVDVHRFRSLLASARDAEPGEARRSLHEALALWRGAPLHDVDSERLHSAYVPRLIEEWFSAAEQRIDLMLDRGEHLQVLPELRGLAARHPSREPLWRRLMLALYRAGRQADALDAYEQLRGHLATSLGIDPGGDLQQMRQAVLVNDPLLDLSPSAQAPPPRQLPSDIAGFVGRAEHLNALDTLLPKPGPAAPPDQDPPIVLGVVSGAGGAGKTTLAVHWAHRVAHQFPDGQLHVNLRGYGPTDPIEPAVALDGFLRALGTPPEQIPHHVDARSALLRTLLAGRRMLLLLDNARDAEQVRPLLPGSGSLVLVTSRNQLRGLAVRERARLVALDQFTPDESTAHISTALGPERVANEPDAAAQLGEACGHLPLALAIIIEQASRRPEVSLSALVTELRQEQHRLDAFDLGADQMTNLRAVISWSFRGLDENTAGVFRRLALHPGNDFSPHAAAALHGATLAATRRVLDRLAEAHLLQQKQPGRYEQHDLIRAYAGELSLQNDTGAVRSDAMRNVVIWYLYCADYAMRLLRPQRTVRIGPARSEIPAPFQDQTTALRWCDEHRGALVASVSAAAGFGHHDLASRLAFVLWPYFLQRHTWDDWLACHSIGLDSARQAGDLLGQGRLLNTLGILHNELRAYDQTLVYYQEALDIFRKLGDQRRQAAALNNLGLVYQELHRPDEAIEHHQRSIAISRENGEDLDAAADLGGLARALVKVRRYSEALTCAHDALTVLEAAANPREAAFVHVTLGHVHAGLKAPEAALAHLEQALAIYTTVGDRGYQGRTLTEIGQVQRDRGQISRARQSWRGALGIFDELRDPRADDVRRHINSLDAGAAPPEVGQERDPDPPPAGRC